jgi:hypothetical protein
VQTDPEPHRSKERPGWMALALIAVFVLVAMVMYVVGAKFVTRWIQR